jgi:hypothetical protein
MIVLNTKVLTELFRPAAEPPIVAQPVAPSVSLMRRSPPLLAPTKLRWPRAMSLTSAAAGSM